MSFRRSFYASVYFYAVFHKKKKSQRRLFLFVLFSLNFSFFTLLFASRATFSGEERREKREKKRWFCSAKHLSASSNPSAETHIHLFRTPLTVKNPVTLRGCWIFLIYPSPGFRSRFGLCLEIAVCDFRFFATKCKPPRLFPRVNAF